MPSLNFPNNPSLNQIYTANNTSWQWNGTSWVRSNNGIQGTQGTQGIQGIQGIQGTIGDTFWVNTPSGIHTTTNVGIATTTADSSYALDVHGDTRISGILTGNVGYLGGQLEVAGITTFQNNVFINGALVAGSGGGGASIGDDIVTRNLYASGVSTFVGAISGSSASFTGDLTVGGELRYEDVTNVDSIGIATARSGLRVTGGGLDVVGVATFNNGIDTLDVIGHAELDQLRVSGVSTFTGNIDANGDLDVENNTELNTVNVSGASTFVGVGTFQDDLFVAGALDVDGNINFNGLLFQDNSPFISSYWIQNSSGIHTLGSVGVGTTNPVGSLEIAGHTELDDVNVSGVSTFVGVGTFQNDLYVGNNIDVDGNINFNGLLFQNDSPFISSYWVQTGAGIHTLGSVGVGTTNPAGSLEVSGHTELDDVNVSGVSTFVGIVTTQSDVFVGNDLSVAGDARIVGVLTVGSSSVTINGDTNTINVGSGVTIHTTTTSVNQLEVAGLSTFVGIATFQNTLFAQELNVISLSVDGGATLGDDLETRNISASGIVTVTGDADINGDLDVDGHTELDNVNISGVLTATSAEFSGNVTVLGDLTYENVLNVDSVGIATARAGLRVTGGGLEVSGVSTFSGNIDLNSDLDVDGHAEFDNVNVSGVLTATSFVGDGSQLTGVSGFATALSNDQTSPLNKIFKTPKSLYIQPSTQVDINVGADEGNLAFMRESVIIVGSGATFHIGSGTTLRTNVLNLF